MVKRQFLGFKDAIRFGSVVGILSYFNGQLNFPGASIKFQDVFRISMSCRHPVTTTTTFVAVGDLFPGPKITK